MEDAGGGRMQGGTHCACRRSGSSLSPVLVPLRRLPGRSIRRARECMRPCTRWFCQRAKRRPAHERARIAYGLGVFSFSVSPCPQRLLEQQQNGP